MELMVVVALIGILTAMIIPEMKGTFEDTLLRSTGRDVVNVIELASSRAISLNQTLRVRLDAVSGRFEIERLRREGVTEDFVPLKDLAGAKGNLDKRISIRIYELTEDSTEASAGAATFEPSPEPALAFYPDGTADGAMIVLKDRAGFRLELRVNAVTARVTIREPARE
jgi:Tfp pilus assembly protein FimT